MNSNHGGTSKKTEYIFYFTQLLVRPDLPMTKLCIMVFNHGVRELQHRHFGPMSPADHAFALILHHFHFYSSHAVPENVEHQKIQVITFRNKTIYLCLKFYGLPKYCNLSSCYKLERE